MGRRLALFALVAVLVLSLFVLAGCSDQQDEANAAMDRANEYTEQWVALDEEIAGLLDQVWETSDDEAGSQEALGYLDEASQKIAERGELLKKERAELESILGMDVSDDYKSYVKMHIEVSDGATEADEKLQDIVGKLQAVVQATLDGSVDDATFEQMLADVDTGFGELGQIMVGLEEKEASAEEFYQEKGFVDE